MYTGWSLQRFYSGLPESMHISFPRGLLITAIKLLGTESLECLNTLETSDNFLGFLKTLFDSLESSENLWKVLGIIMNAFRK